MGGPTITIESLSRVPGIFIPVGIVMVGNKIDTFTGINEFF
jgi:hypothetical protein